MLVWSGRGREEISDFEIGQSSSDINSNLHVSFDPLSMTNLINIELCKCHGDSMELIDIQHKVNQILDLFVLRFRRQCRKAFQQSIVEVYLGVVFDIGSRIRQGFLEYLLQFRIKRSYGSNVRSTPRTEYGLLYQSFEPHPDSP